MEKFKSGDIVVSLIDQSTSSDENHIPKGYFNSILGSSDDYRDDTQEIWFYSDNKGAYKAKNFRLATRLEMDHFDVFGAGELHKNVILAEKQVEAKFPEITNEYIGSQFICRKNPSVFKMKEGSTYTLVSISSGNLTFKEIDGSWCFSNNSIRQYLELVPKVVMLPAKQGSVRLLDEFPNTGCCENVSKEFVEFVQKKVGGTKQNQNSKHTAIGWNLGTRSYWFLEDVRKSTKPRYRFEQFANIYKPSVSVSSPVKEDPRITEAKKRYPIGTKYHPAHLPGTSQPCIVDSQNFEASLEYVYLGDGNEKKNGHNYNEVVWYNGKWAEIDEPEPESKPEPKFESKFGKYYYVEYSFSEYDSYYAIFRHDSDRNFGPGVTSKGSFLSANNWTIEINKRVATSEEIEWLNHCMERQKFIPKEKVAAEIAQQVGNKIHTDIEKGILPPGWTSTPAPVAVPKYKIGDYVETLTNNIGSSLYQFGWITDIDLSSMGGWDYRVTYDPKREKLGVWCKLKGHAVPKEESPKPIAKFKVGDEVEADDTGYQYSTTQAKWEDILNCNIKSQNSKGTVHSVEYSHTNHKYWYRIHSQYSNFFNEECLYLAGTKPQSPPPPPPVSTSDSPIRIGDYVIVTQGGQNDSSHKWFKLDNTLTASDKPYRVEDLEHYQGNVHTVKINNTAYRANYVKKVESAYMIGLDPYQPPMTKEESFPTLCLMDVKQPAEKLNALQHQSPLVRNPVTKSKLIIL